MSQKKAAADTPLERIVLPLLVTADTARGALLAVVIEADECRFQAGHASEWWIERRTEIYLDSRRYPKRTKGIPPPEIG